MIFWGWSQLNGCEFLFTVGWHQEFFCCSAWLMDWTVTSVAYKAKYVTLCSSLKGLVSVSHFSVYLRNFGLNFWRTIVKRQAGLAHLTQDIAREMASYPSDPSKTFSCTPIQGRKLSRVYGTGENTRSGEWGVCRTSASRSVGSRTRAAS